MSAVSQFYQLTIELIQLLSSAEERDGKITNVEALLDKREGLMNQILPPFTPEEVEVGRKLTHLNSRLMELLQREKMMIQKDLKDVQTKKESNTKYVNPYQNLSTDGMFYDKRN